MGSIEKRTGVWYGISLDRNKGSHSGTINKRTYFNCKANHGIFVKLDKIIRIVEESKESFRLSLFEPLKLPEYGKGMIKFVGKMHSNKGIWYGIELQKNLGNCDGTIKNIHYFECKNSFGTFIRQDKLFAMLRGLSLSLFVFYYLFFCFF